MTPSTRAKGAITVQLTPEIRRDYCFLLHTCEIKRDKVNIVKIISEKIRKSEDRYRRLEEASSVPWWFIGLLHSLESGCRFSTHLHNGDPLKARTVNAPKGRPLTGTPPFTFEQSAIDALKYDKVFRKTDWDIATTLHRLEGFNGFGYRSPEININSPYLWSFSNHYERGKYTQDHHFDPMAISAQAGAAVILRYMLELGWISIPMADGDFWAEYAPGVYSEEVEYLQRILNSLPGIFLTVDGFAGPKTDAAFERVSGIRLPRR